MLSRLDWAFPHYSVAVNGSWEAKGNSKNGPADMSFVKNPQVLACSRFPLSFSWATEVPD